MTPFLLLLTFTMGTCFGAVIVMVATYTLKYYEEKAEAKLRRLYPKFKPKPRKKAPVDLFELGASRARQSASPVLISNSEAEIIEALERARWSGP